MEKQGEFLIAVTVTRGYGATAYLVGHGDVFERACRKAYDASGRKPLSQFPELLQDSLPLDEAQLRCAEVQRFGGFSSHERAEEILRKAGITRVVEALLR